jgi:SAM-dependent methyltransferase
MLSEVEACGETETVPALELACGTGRLLIPYRQDGFDVEGLDASVEMLAICRQKAEAAGVSVTLHRAAMESFALRRRFRVVYCPVGSLCLLTTADAVRSALCSIFAHLEPGGRTALSLLRLGGQPAAAADGRKLARQGVRRSDGAVFRVWRETMPPVEPDIVRSRSTTEKSVDGKVVAAFSHVFDVRPIAPAESIAALTAAGFVDTVLLDARGSAPISSGEPGYVVLAKRSA